jgi:hypothetical protein
LAIWGSRDIVVVVVVAVAVVRVSSSLAWDFSGR